MSEFNKYSPAQEQKESNERAGLVKPVMASFETQLKEVTSYRNPLVNILHSNLESIHASAKRSNKFYNNLGNNSENQNGILTDLPDILALELGNLIEQYNQSQTYFQGVDSLLDSSDGPFEKKDELRKIAIQLKYFQKVLNMPMLSMKWGEKKFIDFWKQEQFSVPEEETISFLMEAAIFRKQYNLAAQGDASAIEYVEHVVRQQTFSVPEYNEFPIFAQNMKLYSARLIGTVSSGYEISQSARSRFNSREGRNAAKNYEMLSKRIQKNKNQIIEAIFDDSIPNAKNIRDSLLTYLYSDNWDVVLTDLFGSPEIMQNVYRKLENSEGKRTFFQEKLMTVVNDYLRINEDKFALPLPSNYTHFMSTEAEIQVENAPHVWEGLTTSLHSLKEKLNKAKIAQKELEFSEDLALPEGMAPIKGAKVIFDTHNPHTKCRVVLSWFDEENSREIPVEFTFDFNRGLFDWSVVSDPSRPEYSDLIAGVQKVILNVFDSLSNRIIIPQAPASQPTVDHNNQPRPEGRGDTEVYKLRKEIGKVKVEPLSTLDSENSPAAQNELIIKAPIVFNRDVELPTNVSPGEVEGFLGAIESIVQQHNDGQHIGLEKLTDRGKLWKFRLYFGNRRYRISTEMVTDSNGDSYYKLVGIYKKDEHTDRHYRKKRKHR